MRGSDASGAARSVAAAAMDHVDALHQFAHYLTRDAAQAEDLVQETFARCLAKHGQFSPGTNLKAWLFKILRNAFLDSRRRDRRNPVSSGADVEETSDEREGGEPLRGDAELDRLRSLVAGDIEAALATLSDDARAVVLLDARGFAEAEMAEVMGCAPGTIKSRLARARAALRTKLEEYAR